MKCKNIIFILSLNLSILSSCSTLKGSIDNENRVMLNNSNFKLIEGKYSIRASETSFSNLDWYLFSNDYWYLFKNTYYPDSSHYVKLEVVNKKTLNVSYVPKSCIENPKIETRKIRGRLKNGYFVLDRNLLVVPFIFTNLYRNRQLRMGLLNSGNLITDYNEISFGTVMIVFPFWVNDKDFDVEFRRIQRE